MTRYLFRAAPSHSWSRLAPYALCCLLGANFCGCGEESSDPKIAPADGAKASADNPTEAKRAPPATPPATTKSNQAKIADTATDATANSKPTVVTEVANTPRTPATVKDNRSMPDLTKVPLPLAAQVLKRTIAHVQYRVLGELKPVFDYARRELEKQGW